jgi:hypothetical protein
MPANPRKRQQKVERRAAKRKEKKHQLVRAQSTGLADKLTMSTRFPVLHSVITDANWKQGMGSVLFSRALPDGTVAVTVFLIDRYCLGVKDATVAIVSRSEYESRFHRGLLSRTPGPEVPPAEARKYVEAAVDYARGLGFPPHADYQKAKLIFGDVDASACTATFEFGKGGKPMFINGPRDTALRCRQIINTLTRTCGQGNFEILMLAGPGGYITGPEHLDEDDFDDDLEQLHHTP